MKTSGLWVDLGQNSLTLNTLSVHNFGAYGCDGGRIGRKPQGEQDNVKMYKSHKGHLVWGLRERGRGATSDSPTDQGIRNRRPSFNSTLAAQLLARYDRKLLSDHCSNGLPTIHLVVKRSHRSIITGTLCGNQSRSIKDWTGLAKTLLYGRLFCDSAGQHWRPNLSI